jgi:hypothetical protein
MLPKIEHPIHEIELISIGKTVKFRPFLVKEEKILLMALESNEEKTMLDAIKQIIQNCIIEPTDFNLNEVAVYDLELFFLKLRAYSMGEIVETKYTCQNVVESGNRCGHLMDVSINLLDIKMIGNVENKIVKFNENVGVKMNHPNITSLQKITEINLLDDPKNVIDFIYDCMEYVFDNNQIYTKEEVNKEEFTEFIENMSKAEFAKFENYFMSLPKVQHLIEKTCERCNFDHKIVLEGIGDFFE